MEHWFRAVCFKQEQEEGDDDDDDDDIRLFLSRYHYNFFIANAVGLGEWRFEVNYLTAIHMTSYGVVSPNKISF